MKKHLLFSLILLLSVSCKDHSSLTVLSDEEIDPIYIQRFDKEFLIQIENEGCSDLAVIQRNYPEFFSVYVESVLGVSSVDSVGYERALFDYFANPNIRQLYWDTLLLYDDIEDIQSELSRAVSILHSYIPSMNLPAFYAHVSGLNQSVVVGDNFISLSLDKYLGNDYPFYQASFYSYERRCMNSHHIVKDYLAAWYYSNYSCNGETGMLIDHIIYYGRLYYLYSLLFPKKSEQEIMDFTNSEMKWFEKNEAYLWTSLVNDHKLFQTDPLFASKLLGNASFSLFTLGTVPGKAGIWLGYKIVKSYVASGNVTELDDLLSEKNYRRILEKSKYNP